MVARVGVAARRRDTCARSPSTTTRTKSRKALLNAFVDALIERAAGDRLQRVAVLLRVRCGGVRVERFLVLPDLDDREVIRAHCVLQNVEPQASLFVTTGLRQSREQTRRV